MKIGTTHPLKDRTLYPEPSAVTRKVAIVEDPPMAEPAEIAEDDGGVAPNAEGALSDDEPDAVAVPDASAEGEIGDTAIPDLTVQ